MTLLCNREMLCCSPDKGSQTKRWKTCVLCSVLFFLFTGFKVTITCYQVNNLAKRPPAFRHVQLILAHVRWGKEGILCRIGTVLSAIRPSIEMATVSMRLQSRSPSTLSRNLESHSAICSASRLYRAPPFWSLVPDMSRSTFDRLTLSDLRAE